MREDIPEDLIQIINDAGFNGENLALVPPEVLALLVDYGRHKERAEIVEYLRLRNPNIYEDIQDGEHRK